MLLRLMLPAADTLSYYYAADITRCYAPIDIATSLLPD